jgi:hypothetical protein
MHRSSTFLKGMTMKYSTLFAVLIMALGLSACAGPPGATGPPGAMGPTGYQGPTGRTGQTGQSGVETIVVPTAYPRRSDYWPNDNYYYYNDR